MRSRKDRDITSFSIPVFTVYCLPSQFSMLCPGICTGIKKGIEERKEEKKEPSVSFLITLSQVVINMQSTGWKIYWSPLLSTCYVYCILYFILHVTLRRCSLSILFFSLLCFFIACSFHHPLFIPEYSPCFGMAWIWISLNSQLLCE